MATNHTHFENAEFPKDAEGRCYHVGVKVGEVTNRIVSVGDPCRAILLGSFLDGGAKLDAKRYKDFLNFKGEGIMVRTSKRLFTTVTGRYKGVPVSIVAIGMGLPMMDFFLREVRAVVSGPLHIIRFGSCGALNHAKAGDIVVALESLACTRNPDFFKSGKSQLSLDSFTQLADQKMGPYSFSLPSASDPALSKALIAALQTYLPTTIGVHTGLDVTADSFYSSQGRGDASFKDENAHLFEYVQSKYPQAESLQMETFNLFHLAECTTSSVIHAAACAMVFANRMQNTWIDPTLAESLEASTGKAVLEALISVEVDPNHLHPEEGSVWAYATNGRTNGHSNGH